MPISTQQVAIYRHVQDTASNAWTIVHGMASYPIVDVYIPANGVVQKILPQGVVYVDQNTVQINFSTPQTGFASVAG